MILLTSLLLFSLLLVEEEGASPSDEVFVSKHQAQIGGRLLNYTATAGTLVMRDETGAPIAQFGYTAYVANDGDPVHRPLLFAYNGGPGSASIWLHMGILGPERAVVVDAGFSPNGPYQRLNNEFSILDRSDLVMIDPVGTGFSRPLGEAKGEDFWGVDQDIASVSNFIVRYVTDNGRWLSPKYLLGESYGGIRSGGVSYDLLRRHNLTLNGVILVSPHMDFVAGRVGLKMDLPYVLFFTTYAATAWYHEAIEERPEDLQVFLREAERFAETTYSYALFRGNRLTAEERQQVLRGLARFTGLDEDYWDRANLRLDESQFAKELLRKVGKTVGRIDSRFKGDSINLLGERFTYDPFFPAVGPSFVAAFQDYYRNELGVDLKRDYVVSGRLWEEWDLSHKQPDQGRSSKVPFANTAVDLAFAMVQNPNMKLLVQQGYFDLATPYGATKYFLDHMDLRPELRENIVVKYYAAGHMMYLHPPSMARFKLDLAEFIE
jgi:carboxypeptidase C (cathepsin A)